MHFSTAVFAAGILLAGAAATAATERTPCNLEQLHDALSAIPNAPKDQFETTIDYHERTQTLAAAALNSPVSGLWCEIYGPSVYHQPYYDADNGRFSFLHFGDETLTQFETVPTGTYEAVTAMGSHVNVEKRVVTSFGIRWLPTVEAHFLHLPMPPETAREIAPHLRGYMVADLQAPLTSDTVEATAPQPHRRSTLPTLSNVSR